VELKGKREVFCREYLKDLDGTQAATRAGYSAHSARQQACDLLAEQEIQDRVAELSAARNQKFEVEAVEVLRELHRLATQDPIALVNENGVPHELADIPIDLRRTIASIEIEELYAGRGEARENTGRLHKIKFWNKNAALEALGRHLALFKDVIEHRFDGGAPPADIETAAKAAAILEAARREAKEIAALV